MIIRDGVLNQEQEKQGEKGGGRTIYPSPRSANQ